MTLLELLEYTPKVHVIRRYQHTLETDMENFDRIQVELSDPTSITVKVNDEHIAKSQIRDVVIAPQKLKIHKLPNPFRTQIRDRIKLFRSRTGRTPPDKVIAEWVESLQRGKSLYGSKPVPELPVIQIYSTKPKRKCLK